MMAAIPTPVNDIADEPRLDVARDAFRRSPTEANAQECERLFRLLHPDKWLEDWSERV